MSELLLAIFLFTHSVAFVFGLYFGFDILPRILSGEVTAAKVKLTLAKVINFSSFRARPEPSRARSEPARGAVEVEKGDFQ